MDGYGIESAFLRGPLKRFAQQPPLPLAEVFLQAGRAQAIFDVHVANFDDAVVHPIQDFVEQLVHALVPVQTRAPVALTTVG